MRAHEFVGEKIAPETVRDGFRRQQVVNNGQWLITATGETIRYGGNSGITANVLHIKVYDRATSKQLAWVDFLVKTRPEDGEQYLESVYTTVDKDYRGQGLGRLMYQYANSLGNDIQPSELQTDAGRGMWKSFGSAVRQTPALPVKPEPAPKPAPKPTMWQRLKKAVA